jgi:hypothetical protein
VKEEVGAYMQQWYRNTHGVNCASNAEDMSVILEAYWILAAKRCVPVRRQKMRKSGASWRDENNRETCKYCIPKTWTSAEMRFETEAHVNTPFLVISTETCPLLMRLMRESLLGVVAGLWTRCAW